ncbi:hypothetical protein ACJ72_07219 [Emergomyces africanus]|uniref:Dihydrofolate reductase n=1 Tax=Emergomyces africanus TaxID=1955775 RepID=A0A1B7NPD0_9EURO|nr:hypothetical protein ACJ72_07219 [Emergomyces africanus]
MPTPTSNTATDAMPPPLTTPARALFHQLHPLILIVATTPITTPDLSNSPSNPSSSPTRSRCHLGIGHAGTLPWPRIKTDMTFFSRVTTRAPLPPPPTSSLAPEPKCENAINAVIMGRKTYDSLPSRVRPLPGRINVVVTRDKSGREKSRIEGEWKAAREREREREKEREKQKKGQEGGITSSFSAVSVGDNSKTIAHSSATIEDSQPPDVLIANSLESALMALYDAFRTDPTPGPLSHNSTRHLANIFVIGGGEIYASALNLKLDPAVYGGEPGGVIDLRIVMTDVRKCPVPPPTSSNDSRATTVTTLGVEAEGMMAAENAVNGFECDTFFPIDGDELEGSGEWRRVSSEDVSNWVGEEVKDGWVREGEVVLRVVGFERRM